MNTTTGVSAAPPTTAPRIFYLTVGKPTSGGQHVNEEHVDALRQLGWDAYLLLWPRSKEPQPSALQGDTSAWAQWDCCTPVVRYSGPEVLRPGDVVVVPEPWRVQLAHFAKLPVRKVVHCQNPYYAFHGAHSMAALRRAGYADIITCSDFTSAQLRKMGWQGDLHTVPPQIRSAFLQFAHGKEERLEESGLQISFMPRKRPIEAKYVQGLFQALYPKWAQVPWQAIEGMTREQCAKAMGQSAVFASLSHLEGLGLPPLEAMASGCVVAGFMGGGGADFATPANGFWVAEGDHEGFCQALNQALMCATTPAWRHAVLASAEQALRAHSPQAFKSALDRAWQRIACRALPQAQAQSPAPSGLAPAQ